MSVAGVDHGGGGVITRGLSRSTIASSPAMDSVTPRTLSDVDTAPDLKDLRRLFNKVYTKWSRAEPIDENDMSAITALYVTEENFLKLTEFREFGKYIALIDYRIRFDELPLMPHGEVAGAIQGYLHDVFQSGTQNSVLVAANDNGIGSSI